MSNTQVGNVYQQIIADVVDSSRVDFEEGGVDEQVLEELKRGWQKKLSQLQVAMFPWDPKPEPPAIQNPPTTEPGMDPQGFLPMPMPQPAPQNPLMTMPNATPAQQRAAQNLHASFGPRAAASIQSIQGGGGAPQQQAIPQMSPQQQHAMHAQQQQHLQMQQMQQQQQQQQQQQRPGSGVPPQAQPQQPQGQPQSQQAATAYRQSMVAQQAQQTTATEIISKSTKSSKQSEWSSNPDFPGSTSSPNPQAPQAPQAPQNPQNSQGNEIAMGRVEIDNLIRTKIESMGKAMEGGGLMLPLKEATKTSSNKPQRKTLSGSVPQTDGPGSDDDDDDDDKVKDELDEDAINSDLDDSDDGLNDDEDEDEGMGHIMLCMYDKVQRVKNKWKCVMKDGVLTVNGKEYVFHKATGEYEW
ncbi:hypothetical protein DID88_000094 [Monilinia fructigena]|uniref:Transcription initiation factor IIA large subunit n=1 Tax=Monilinia fructigena TaxID=38457 RepID=A0A395ILB6_9HELO|nr:hypothetical protein DID88_000094 [Monilinia fructigena]